MWVPRATATDAGSVRIGVTGAAGFVGGAVVEAARARGMTPVALVHRTRVAGIETRVVGDLAELDDASVVSGLDAVIHCAARVHRVRETPAEAKAGHARTNTQGTRRLAEACAAAGVPRLVFCSSVKAMAERDPGDGAGGARPLRADDPPRPQDAYGRSKLAAESGLWKVCERFPMQGVVVRPPLVHGAGAGGNLRALMAVLDRGWPLPLGGIANRRSLISKRNLADLLVHAALHEAAPGGTFLVADGPPVSTPDLLRRLGAALGRSTRLVSLPGAVLTAITWADRRGRLDRLTGSLSVDDGETRWRLGWTPPQTMEEGLAEMADARRVGTGGQLIA